MLKVNLQMEVLPSFKEGVAAGRGGSPQSWPRKVLHNSAEVIFVQHFRTMILILEINYVLKVKPGLGMEAVTS
jgi:hypothetical protein